MSIIKKLVYGFLDLFEEKSKGFLMNQIYEYWKWIN